MLYCTMCNALFLRTIIYQCFCGVHCSDTSPIRKHYVSPPASLTTAGPGIWRQYKGRAGGTPGSPGAAPLWSRCPTTLGRCIILLDLQFHSFTYYLLWTNCIYLLYTPRSAKGNLCLYLPYIYGYSKPF